MVYLGLFIIFNNPIVYLVGIPLILLVYVSIVAAEEKYLGGKFGTEYADYCTHVNRWIPSLGGLKKTAEGMTFSWLRVLLREYSSTYTWVTGVLALLAYESLAHSTVQKEQHRIMALAVMWVAVTVLWIVVRYLKLSGKLRAD